MGVHGLWTLLDQVQEPIPLRCLGGKKLAIDLSGWVCGDIQLSQRANTSCKLYIRNLIFRAIALLREAILPVVVSDGIAPAIKSAAMRGRRPGNLSVPEKPVSLKRSQLGYISAQCCKLMALLGVPCIQSPGEAEAMCAFLNMENLVDGCVTNDGDAFLYGATTVYRHFTLNARDSSVGRYESSRVASQLGLTREALVVLALVLGCDYWPEGVSGVGCVSASRVLALLPNARLALDRLSGRAVVRAEEGADDSDAQVWRTPVWAKITAGLANCPVGEVVSEFLEPWWMRGWELPAASLLVWSRPRVRQAVELCTRLLDWQPTYALAQFTPLLAVWVMRDLAASTSSLSAPCIQPIRIIKKRSVNYMPCFEVEWKRLDDDMWSENLHNPSTSTEALITSLNSFFTDAGYRFSVAAAEFRLAFPSLASAFETVSVQKLTTKLITLSVDGVKQTKLKKATTVKAKGKDKATKKALVTTSVVGKRGATLDAFVRPAPSSEGVALTTLGSSPESSPSSNRIERAARSQLPPLVGGIFTPPPINQAEKENFISVRLSSAFERRLTLRSSLLALTPAPKSPSSVEFDAFKTPPRLIDRLM